mgnify:CR=1 FL=1
MLKGAKEEKMKIATRGLLVLVALLLMVPSRASATDIEWFGILSGYGGAERESGSQVKPSQGFCDGSAQCGFILNGFTHPSQTGKAGVRGSAQALGVIPLSGPFGLQASFNYTGGLGSRIGTTFGPLYDFTSGKVGLFVTYQHRTLRGANFWWLEPAFDYYLGQMNLSVRLIQPLSGAQTEVNRANSGCGGSLCGGEEFKRVDLPINRLQGTMSYFPSDIPWFGKDNLELTLGVQVNDMWGPGAKTGAAPNFVTCCPTFHAPSSHPVGVGVGPIFGISAMPFQNVELTVVKGTIDNRQRFEIQSGLRIFFGGKGTPFGTANAQSLKDLRRKYMEASPYPVASYTGKADTDSKR